MRDTIFLLDVDGPINADKPGWSAPPFNGWAYAKDKGKHYRMRWAPQLISRLRSFNAKYPETIYWATTWCGSTDNLERLFKLPALLSASPTAMSGDMKRRAALEVITSGRRLIWADDEFVPDSGPLYNYLTKDGKALLIRPRTTGKRQGLRPEHLDAIDAFMLGS